MGKYRLVKLVLSSVNVQINKINIQQEKISITFLLNEVITFLQNTPVTFGGLIIFLQETMFVSSEVVVQRCSVKNAFLKFFQNSQENPCAEHFFKIKL